MHTAWKWLGRPSEKFWPKKHFVSILCQWMFHESVLISLGFPAEKHWSWFWVFLVKKKFSLVQFILFPFPFCHGKKNRTLKSYGVFSIINHFLIPFVSQYTVENDKEKIPKKNCKPNKNNLFWSFSQEVHSFLEKYCFGFFLYVS